MNWEPISLGELGESAPARPTLGAFGLTYPGSRTSRVGPPESLKTLIAYIELLEVIRAGGRVILIDFETGPYEARDRLRDLGASVEEIAAIIYVEPETAATPEIIAGLVALEADLVVIDAAAGAYDLQGLDDNKRQDVERFARLYVRAFWKAGTAVIVLDHVTKATEQRGRFAIGSERKLGGVDVALGFEIVGIPLSRGGSSTVKITTHKDRFGHLPRPVAGLLRLTSDADTHRISWTFERGGDAGVADGWKPTQLMEKVSRCLERQTEPIARGAIVDLVGGQRAYVLQAIDELVAGGYASESRGARGAKLTAFAKPFRVPDPFSAVPANGSSPPVLPFSPLQGGNGSGGGVDEPDESIDLDHLERLAEQLRADGLIP